MEHASKDLCRRRLRSPGPAPANYVKRADAYDAHVQREVIAETSRIVVLLPERTIARRSGRVGVGYGQNMGRMTKNCEGGAG